MPFIIRYLSWQARKRFGVIVGIGDYSLKWIAAAKCAQWHS